MSHKDVGRTGGRQAEDKYFHKKERELIEKLKQRAAKEQERKALADSVGVSDEGILKTLQEMGYNRDAVMALHLFPLVVVAWADGEVSAKERSRIIQAARTWGILEGTAADKKLAEWLNKRPDPVTSDRALSIIRDILQYRKAGQQEEYMGNFMRLSEEVAMASGGILGLGRKISARERAAIEHIVNEISANHAVAAKKMLSGS